MRTARVLEAEWRQVLRGSVGMMTKEDESSTQCVSLVPKIVGSLPAEAV
jgi:hypothetical protein